MKGLIFVAYREAIIKKFDSKVWFSIFEKSSFPKEFPLLKTEIYDDKYFFELLEISAKELNVEYNDLYELFAEYFLNEYVPKNLFYVVENIRSSRDMFRNLDLIHEILSLSASLELIPRFEYTEADDAKEAILIYKSQRKLYDLFYIMTKTVCEKYGDCRIERVASEKLKIVYK